MSNKIRMMLLTMVVFALMASGLYYASGSLFGEHFRRHEQCDIEESTLRINHQLAGDMEMLSSQVGDWASWDDAYGFVENGNRGFINTNILPASFIELRANVILFVNNAGRIIYEGWFDRKSGEMSGARVSIHNHLGPDSRLLKLEYPSSSVTGILNLAEGPLLVAARPILPTRRDAPIRGTLIMGRFLDEGEIVRLTKESRLQFAVARVGDPYMSPEFSSAQTALQEKPGILVKTSDGKGLLAYSYFNDLYGRPSFIMRVDIPQSASLDGQKVIERFRMMLIACAVIAAVILSVLLTKFCFLPVEAVDRAAERKESIPVEKSKPSEEEKYFVYEDEELPETSEDTVEENSLVDRGPDPADELPGKEKAG